MFQALVLNQQSDGTTTVSLQQLAETQLPSYPVQLKVLYSSLNYKDALAITHSAPVIKSFPMVPGIDCCGEVIYSADPQWQVGQQAILTGFGIGENHWGGLAERIAAPAEWLVALPQELTPFHAMAIGTAGLTAMLAINQLEKQGISPSSGKVLVTGAAGGVGSFSVWLLSQLGYTVIAASGKPQADSYLKQFLGATETLARDSLNQPGRPLRRPAWIAAIDTLGSHTLANVLAATDREGVVMACGMAQGLELPASTAAFILRGITLQGVDSVYCALNQRQQAW
jgi:acrylyl-CoA reductase (NADPH)